MPEVNVEINGRKYRMACEEGQEPHLIGLADRFNRSIDYLKNAFCEIGDNRLTVMAGIAALDELEEAEKRIDALQKEVAELTHTAQHIAQDAKELESRFAKKLSETARKVEAIATADYPTPARRQANSRLDHGAIRTAYGIAPRPWQDALDDILDELMGTPK